MARENTARNIFDSVDLIPKQGWIIIPPLQRACREFEKAQSALFDTYDLYSVVNPTAYDSEQDQVTQYWNVIDDLGFNQEKMMSEVRTIYRGSPKLSEIDAQLKSAIRLQSSGSRERSLSPDLSGGRGL